MIKYSEIQFLPEDHPKHIAFIKELEKAQDEFDAAEFVEYSCLDDEESKAYFDRYIAGDR